MKNTEHPELLKHRHTFASLPGDFSFWHKNREKYTVWALEITDSQLEERLKQARSTLSGFLIEDYNRHPHITISQCGFLCQQKKRRGPPGPRFFFEALACAARSAAQKTTRYAGG